MPTLSPPFHSSLALTAEIYAAGPKERASERATELQHKKLLYHFSILLYLKSQFLHFTVLLLLLSISSATIKASQAFNASVLSF